MFGNSKKRIKELDDRRRDLIQQRDQAKKERDRLRVERDQARKERDEFRIRSIREVRFDASGDPRALLAARYMQGDGIEIGALHYPLPLPASARVKYVDYKDRETSIKTHPELNPAEIVEVDIITNGETLEGIADESVDFVIANHMLEHCERLIEVFRNLYRVVKPGGILFLSLPDKRYTFDYKRELTPFSHIKEETSTDPLENRYAHYNDFVTNCSFASAAGNMLSEETVKTLPHLDIHYHVWDQQGLIELFNRIRTEFNMPYEIEAAMKGGNEGIFVLRKLTVDPHALARERGEA